jgi:hypothetical protein
MKTLVAEVRCNDESWVLQVPAVDHLTAQAGNLLKAEDELRSIFGHDGSELSGAKSPLNFKTRARCIGCGKPCRTDPTPTRRFVSKETLTDW